MFHWYRIGAIYHRSQYNFRNKIKQPFKKKKKSKQKGGGLEERKKETHKRIQLWTYARSIFISACLAIEPTTY